MLHAVKNKAHVYYLIVIEIILSLNHSLNLISADMSFLAGGLSGIVGKRETLLVKWLW